MILPSVFPASKKGHPEEMVFNALRPLADTYDIFYSRSFSGLSEKEDHYYEIDFIIARPNHSLLVLEVKGGIIEFVPEKGKWLQNKKPFDHEQAMKNSNNLLQRFDKLKHVIPISWAFCFPECERVNEADALPPPFDSSNVITRLELPFIKDKLEQIFEAIDQHFPPRHHIDKNKYYQRFKATLSRGYGFVHSLSNTIRLANEKFIELTLKQQQVIEYARQYPKIVIEGVAGSGKTIIAQSQALEDAVAGKKVLFLCFNRNLADLLSTQLDDLDNCIINTFHGYLEQVIEQKEPGWFHQNNNGSSDWFEVDVPFKYLELREDAPHFDTLIIDEGQDFNQDWIAMLLDELKPEGSCLIFTDHGQNIFHRESKETQQDFKSIMILENCRNTRKINSYLNATLGKNTLSKENAPEGTEVIAKQFENQNELIDYLNGEIHRLTKVEKIEISDIVILTNVSSRRSLLHDLDGLAGYQLMEYTSENNQRPNVILYSNPYRFKGLESEVVITINESNHEDLIRKYVLLSRAKNVLYSLDHNNI